jgi:hypothetical protein
MNYVCVYAMCVCAYVCTYNLGRSRQINLIVNLFKIYSKTLIRLIVKIEER